MSFMFNYMEADLVPNPILDPVRCGRSAPGQVCDPDGILTVSEMDIIDKAVEKSSHCEFDFSSSG